MSTIIICDNEADQHAILSQIRATCDTWATVNVLSDGRHVLSLDNYQGDISKYGKPILTDDEREVLVTGLTTEELQERKNAQARKKKIDFGVELIEKYRAKNDVLGFDALTRPQRKSINAILRRVFRELQDGYLKDAIEEIRETVNADFDGIYVRKSRYLKLRNEIHTFLGLPLVNNYNE